MNTKKFNTRILAAILSLAFIFISAAWSPQPAAAQEAAPAAAVQVVVPAMTAETNDQPVPPPPSGWAVCNGWEAAPGYPFNGYDPAACRTKAQDWKGYGPEAGESWFAWAQRAPKPLSDGTSCGTDPEHCNPYPVCSETTEERTLVQDWTYNPQTGQEERIWHIVVKDVNSGTICAEYDEVETRPYAECELLGQPIRTLVQDWTYNPQTGQEERIWHIVVKDVNSGTICAEEFEIETRQPAPQCTKDGLATVYVTVTYTDGKGKVRPLEGQQVGLDVNRDGSVEYADVSNHAGELMFHVALMHWSRDSALVYLGDGREVDPQIWNDVQIVWGDDGSDGTEGWLWGLTDCIAAFGSVELGNPTPINPPVALVPAAPCEEQGG